MPDHSDAEPTHLLSSHTNLGRRTGWPAQDLEVALRLQPPDHKTLSDDWGDLCPLAGRLNYFLSL